MTGEPRLYVGTRTVEDYTPHGEPITRCWVRVFDSRGERELDPRLDVKQKTDGSFEWGYGGAGPTQLAVALICDACGADAAAPHVIMEVKRKITSKLPRDKAWKLSADTIRRVVLDAWPGIVELN